MHGIPKIVLDRLRARPLAPSLPGAPPGSAGVQHPDANLLAAFVEKNLMEKEREQVLNHLAQCVDCREAAALIAPLEWDSARPAPAPARSPRRPWLVLRWSALAAALGAVAIIVVILQHPSRNEKTISKEERPSIIASVNRPVSPSASVSPAPPTGAVAAKESAGQKAKESAGQMARLEKPAAHVGKANVTTLAASSEPKQQVTLMAASRPAPTLEARGGAGGGLEAEASKGQVGTLAGAAMPAPPPAAGAARSAPVAVESEAKSDLTIGTKAGPAGGYTKTETFDATKSVGAARAAGISAETAATAPRVTSRAKMGSQAEVAPMVSTTRLPSAARVTPEGWTISAEGKVQRNVPDSGWVDTPIDDRVTFRTITAIGNDIWAGGTGGALYHSADGGTTWKRIVINAGGTPVTETVVTLHFNPPQSLSVITASGAQWASTDGGQHWQKKL